MFYIRNKEEENKNIHTKTLLTWKGERKMSASQCDQMLHASCLHTDIDVDVCFNILEMAIRRK